MARDTRPACLITGTVSPYRREPFRLLSLRQDVEVLAFENAGDPLDGLTARTTTEAGAVRAAASGRYRAVITSLGGRLALPGSYLAARARGIPFVLWATIWEHPRTLAHRVSFRPTRHLYRHADAVVTYGSHVSAYVARYRGREHDITIAPQAVDVAHFAAEQPATDVAAARARAGATEEQALVLYVGRLEEEKGLDVLLDAWGQTALGDTAVLAIAGEGPLHARAAATEGVRTLGYVGESLLPPLYAAADLLVLPSVPTATFREPWGLVVNEAMLQRTPVITTNAVGAAAGGLVVPGETGAVVPARDAQALAAAITGLAGDRIERERLGANGARAAAKLDAEAWYEGMRAGLALAGAAR